MITWIYRSKTAGSEVRWMNVINNGGLKVRMQVSAARLTWSFLVLWEEAMWARYWMTFFVFSVLPAPDSPLQTQTGENKIVSGLIQHWEDIFCNVTTVDVFIIYNLRAQDGLVFTICTKKKKKKMNWICTHWTTILHIQNEHKLSLQCKTFFVYTTGSSLTTERKWISGFLRQWRRAWV